LVKHNKSKVKIFHLIFKMKKMQMKND